MDKLKFSFSQMHGKLFTGFVLSTYAHVFFVKMTILRLLSEAH